MLRNMTEVCDGVVNSSPNLRQNVVSQFDFEKTSREIRRDSFALSVTVCVCACGGRGGGFRGASGPVTPATGLARLPRVHIGLNK